MRYRWIRTAFESKFPVLWIFLKRRREVVKYLIAGALATATNLVVLLILAEYLDFYYLLASAFAFTSSIAVSFTLQKFWTFEDKSIDQIHAQFVFYLTIVLLNLALNTLIVYLLVEYMKLWYFLSQITAGLIIAIVSFFVYRHFIFTGKDMQ